jgi:uncharacterized protein YkwD
MLTRNHIFILIISFLFFSFQSCTTQKAFKADYHKGYSNSSIESVRARVFDLVNDYRREHGLKPLSEITVVDNVAEAHSRQMAGHHIPLGHAGFEKRYKQIGSSMSGIKGMAENVAYGHLTAEEVVDLWLGSKGHRKNIQGDYNKTGIGIVRDAKGQLYFTQIFVLK